LNCSKPWYHVDNVDEVASPGLLLYPNRIEENLRLMMEMAGGPERLRPHIKTHKLPELITLQLRLGITRFKCATIAEAEMAAQTGAKDILLAYQLVGPNVRRWNELIKMYPATRFVTIVDDEAALNDLSGEFALLLDIDVGQHRCGAEIGPKAFDLYEKLGSRAAGLHVYDGHIHTSDPKERARECEAAFVPVWEFVRQLRKAGLQVPRIVAGGTPTFPIHARNPEVECSPGTCVLWDRGYATKLSDLGFQPAALVLARVISKPGRNRLCLDLGHKAVASEMPHPRVHLLNLPDAKFISHSEEHLVVESDRAAEFNVGDTLYGIPWHICPTIALHSLAIPVRNHRAEPPWHVTARERFISV
jgi:D-threonine aldolase